MWARLKAAWWAFLVLFRVKRALDAPPPPMDSDTKGSG